MVWPVARRGAAPPGVGHRARGARGAPRRELGAEMRVSVAMLTYNHERYIAQAIESVLAQCGVEFQLGISEDCSTDRTREIVDEYVARYPDRIRVLPPEP